VVEEVARESVGVSVNMMVMVRGQKARDQADRLLERDKW